MKVYRVPKPLTAMVGHVRFFIPAFVALGLVVSSSPTAAPAFDGLVVFGDSLSDIGNAGRFSNGPVWVEQLADWLALELKPSQAGGLNFAVGGALLDARAGPHSLRAQTDAFLALPKPNGHTLYVVYGGGNDLLAAVEQPGAPMLVDAAVASLRSIVADLASHGATDVLVPNLPDVGITPEVQSRGTRAVAEARMLADRFNAALDRALAELAGHPQLRLHRLDVWAMAERAKTDPGAFGFVDIRTPCNTLEHCEGYLFWDNVHPTTHAHRRLAEAAMVAVSSP